MYISNLAGSFQYHLNLMTAEIELLHEVDRSIDVKKETVAFLRLRCNRSRGECSEMHRFTSNELMIFSDGDGGGLQLKRHNGRA